MAPVLPLQHHHPSTVRTPPITTSKIARFAYPPILTKPRPVVSPSQPHHGSPQQRGFNYLQASKLHRKHGKPKSNQSPAAKRGLIPVQKAHSESFTVCYVGWREWRRWHLSPYDNNRQCGVLMPRSLASLAAANHLTVPVSAKWAAVIPSPYVPRGKVLLLPLQSD